MSEATRAAKMVSPLEFIRAGLALELERESITSNRARKANANDRTQTSLTASVNMYAKYYTLWMAAVSKHMPTLPQAGTLDHVDELMAKAGEDSDALSHPILQARIPLPSHLTPGERQEHCTVALQEREIVLRIVRMESSLSDMRSLLQRESWEKLSHHKAGTTETTRGRTRAQATYKGIRDCIKLCACRFNDSWGALIRLNETVLVHRAVKAIGKNWQDRYREVQLEDLKPITAGLHTSLFDTEALQEARERELQRHAHPRQVRSWIWDMDAPPGAPGPGMGPSTSTVSNRGQATTAEWMVVWCNAKAKAERWEEELKLVPEEMRRCIAYWQWEVRRWIDIQDGRDSTPSSIKAGIKAYAHRQAKIRQTMIDSASALWTPILQANALLVPF